MRVGEGTLYKYSNHHAGTTKFTSLSQYVEFEKPVRIDRTV